MIDIHTHILPGIDDGATSMDEAVAMVDLAAQNGTQALIVTPHQRHWTWPNDDVPYLERLIEELRTRSPKVPAIHLGGEVRVDGAFLAELDDLGHYGRCTLAGSRYVLLEFSRSHLDLTPQHVVTEVRAAGLYPIVAHPEFLPGLRSHFDMAMDLVAAGGLLQVTAMSLTGEFGPEAQKCTQRLVDEQLVHFIASDGHDLDFRPPELASAWQRVASHWGEPTAKLLMVDNPQAVLEDRKIDVT